MGRSMNDNRLFKCKRCGKDTTESLYRWRKKPQSQKNICINCISNRETARLTARERALDIGYGGLYGGMLRGWPYI